MKKITISIVMALLCLFFKVNGQQRFSKPPLKIGDTIPNLVLNNIVNFSATSINLADYKDKLLIVDFWAISCIPCVRNMPVLYDLQKRFKDKLFILPVDYSTKYDSPEKVKTFFKVRKKLFDLPSATMDTVMYQLFQPPSLGIYVWIKNGIVTNITEEAEATAVNIERVLTGGAELTNQFVRAENDRDIPLFDNGNGGGLPSKYFIRSMLFPYDPKLNGQGYGIDSTGKTSRIFYYNMNMYGLLLLANGDYMHLFKRVIKQTRHLDMLEEYYPTEDSLKKKYLFCYEAIFPPVPYKKALSYVRQDLDRYLPFVVDSISKMDTCWVIKLSKDQKLKIGDSKNTGTNIEEGLGLPVYFNNRALSLMVGILEDINKVPVLNETGGNPNIWITLPGDLKDFSAISKSLQKQGLVLTKEPRPIEYMVIKDRP